jgi:hypothetical protein
MTHLYIFTAVIFTKETGTQYLYFAVPPSIFLVCEYDQTKEKIFFSALSLILFFTSDLFSFHTPIEQLSESSNQLHYFLATLVLQVGVTLAVFLFTLDTHKHHLMQQELIDQLNSALNEVDQLKRIIPICCNCKKIRDDQGYWSQLEAFFESHSKTKFSHSICPECEKKLYPDLAPYTGG